MNTINVVLADDHVLVRDGIKSLLEEEQDITVVDEASDGREALRVVEKKHTRPSNCRYKNAGT